MRGLREGEGLDRRRAAPLTWPLPRERNFSYSIDTRTRSGGRWPSIQVLRLMITFSPMSIRASTVAEPRWGRRTALGSLSSLGLIAGSNSKTSRPAPAMPPAASRSASDPSSMIPPRAAVEIAALGETGF